MRLEEFEQKLAGKFEGHQAVKISKTCIGFVGGGLPEGVFIEDHSDDGSGLFSLTL